MKDFRYHVKRKFKIISKWKLRYSLKQHNVENDEVPSDMIMIWYLRTRVKLTKNGVKLVPIFKSTVPYLEVLIDIYCS